MAKIKKIITLLESPNGKYHGFRVTRCSDGKQVEGQINAGESNIKFALTNDGKNWVHNYYWHTEKTPEKTLFSLPYAGGNPEDIREFVEKAFRKKKA